MRLIAATAACAALLAGAAPAAQASGGPEWSRTKLKGHAGELFLLNVSCASESLCVATGTQNVIATSTNPTGGAGAWKVIYAGEGFYTSPTGPVISSRQVQGISCPSAGLCVAVTTLGQIYSSTNPTGPAASWKTVEISPKGRNVHLYGVSCPTASLCVAVSGRRANKGKVFTSTNPTGGVEAWQEADLGETLDLRAVSCSSASLCVAAGYAGELVVSTNPTGGPAAWTSIGAPGGPGSLQSMSCVAGLCLTGNSGGNLLAAANPLSAAAWSERSSGGSTAVTGVSCADSSACVAVDNNGHVIVSTNPTGPASAWSSTGLLAYSPEVEEFAPEEGNALFGASCPSRRLCVLVGSGGQIITSSNPFAALPKSQQKTATRKAKKRGPKRPRVRIANVRFFATKATRAHRVKVRIRFYAHGPVRRFECRVNHRHFRRCHSPRRFFAGRGTHAFRVRAVGRTGLRGPVTETRFWVGKHCVRHYCLKGAGVLHSKHRH
jgi:hypothetical protein